MAPDRAPIALDQSLDGFGVGHWHHSVSIPMQNKRRGQRSSLQARRQKSEEVDNGFYPAIARRQSQGQCAAKRKADNGETGLLIARDRLDRFQPDRKLAFDFAVAGPLIAGGLEVPR